MAILGGLGFKLYGFCWGLGLCLRVWGFGLGRVSGYGLGSRALGLLFFVVTP